MVRKKVEVTAELPFEVTKRRNVEACRGESNQIAAVQCSVIWLPVVAWSTAEW